MKAPSNLTEFKKYKKAKVINKEIEQIFDLLNTNKKSLKAFWKYKPIQELYYSLLETEAVLKIHHDRQKKILDTMGSSGTNEMEKTSKQDPK